MKMMDIIIGFYLASHISLNKLILNNIKNTHFILSNQILKAKNIKL
jgi:hypothetical protein